jgi:cyclopropane fatty-acyl-phospholipid synthase-like methyltransferase
MGDSTLYHWEEAYLSRPPWDVDHPQPVFVGLVKDGEIRPGRVLDVGCGTGENAIFLAQQGCAVSGVDIVPRAVEQAIKKATVRHVKVDFSLCDVLTLGLCFDEGEFDTVIDSGLFHVMTDEERPVYVKQIHRVLKDNGNYFMMCFSDQQPGDWGPRRVSKQEIAQAFTPLFRINYIKDARFDSLIHDGGARAYLVSATKSKKQ